MLYCRSTCPPMDSNYLPGWRGVTGYCLCAYICVCESVIVSVSVCSPCVGTVSASVCKKMMDGVLESRFLFDFYYYITILHFTVNMWIFNLSEMLVVCEPRAVVAKHQCLEGEAAELLLPPTSSIFTTLLNALTQVLLWSKPEWGFSQCEQNKWKTVRVVCNITVRY